MSKSITAVRPVIINVDEKTGTIKETLITLPAFIKLVDMKSIDAIAGLKAALPEGISENDRVTFRMFHSGIDTAIAGIGGRVTFASFFQSLAALVTASAYGQNLAAHYDRLPPFAEYALKLATTYVGKTESLTLAKLGEVMQQTLQELFTLPLTLPKKAEKSPVVVTQQTTQLSPALVDVPDINVDRTNLSADIADKKADENFRQDMADHAQNLTEMEEKARIEAENKATNEGVDVIQLILKMPDQAQALDLLRNAAESLGYRLTKIPARKVA